MRPQAGYWHGWTGFEGYSPHSPRIGLPLPDTRHPIPWIFPTHRVATPRHPTPDTRYPIPGIFPTHRIATPRHPIPDTRYPGYSLRIGLLLSMLIAKKCKSSLASDKIEIPYRVDHEPDEIVLGNPVPDSGGSGYG